MAVWVIISTALRYVGGYGTGIDKCCIHLTTNREEIRVDGKDRGEAWEG